MNTKHDLEERLKKIESRLKNIELALGVIKDKNFQSNMAEYGKAIYSLLLKYRGTPMTKKRIRCLLGGSEHHWRQAREHLIAQGKMVDGTGSEWVAEKICTTRGGYLIPTAEEVEERQRRRAERSTENKGGE